MSEVTESAAQLSNSRHPDDSADAWNFSFLEFLFWSGALQYIVKSAAAQNSSQTG
jgi:hypothetical protein